jgi:hypothetical protein
MLESAVMLGGRNARAVIAALLIALVMPLCVTNGRTASHHPGPRALRDPNIFLPALPVLADLDGDQAADSINLHSSGFDKTVGIKFANFRISEFSFVSTSIERGRLIANDIDGDGDVDLIWIAGRDRKGAVVLINNGRGDFTQAKDSAPYTSELNALLNSNDPSDQHSLQAGHQIVSLTSPSFSVIDLTSASAFALPESNSSLRIPFNGLGSRSAFLSYLHKRGPPAIFS